MNPKVCGAGAPAREMREAKSKPDVLLPLLVRSFGVLVATLREIFDESAYERFLTQHQLTSSAAAYSSFCHERDHTQARRPRCC
ncbi:MAG TPA: hypothetical protein VF845_14485 [Terriglobales bacterium]